MEAPKINATFTGGIKSTLTNALSGRIRQALSVELARQIAGQARKDFPAGGYIVVADERAVGWIADLAIPGLWVPGLIAVPADNGRCFITTGENAQDGATAWEPVERKDTHA